MKVILGFIFIFVFSAACNADSEGHALILGEQQVDIEDSGQTSKGVFAPVGGIGFMHDSYDFDVLLAEKVYTTGGTTYNAIQLPIFWRFNIADPLHGGAGAYVDYALSHPTGVQAMDYGLDISLEFLAGKTAFLDVRYLYGLANLPGYTRDLEIVLGFNL